MFVLVTSLNAKLRHPAVYCLWTPQRVIGFLIQLAARWELSFKDKRHYCTVDARPKYLFPCFVIYLLFSIIT